ncbi:GNAT family N-acetyltransferase [Photobacterium sp. CAU 1568]|uniref:GNAT family N-acetyltransferase n=1 Tax=Photobacterium arenosum TaxID=2774143 RepID=A0ABR9BNS4_9GAMM|nr:GNAT family N-acetyltransferase [Photobacterium arenosum]MBD8514228.1 GNAT family N-acetyltransferase [Photobacterium arenosum]
MRQPTLSTERLLLRPLQLADATLIQKLAGEPEIALGTTNVPYPYDSGMAGQWIGRSLAGWGNGTLAIFAITLKDTEQLIGCIGLHNIKQLNAQLGFWLGVPFWGHGYCTEAASRLVDFGFFDLKLSRISGQHRRLDPKPGKVLERAGLSFVRVKPDATRVNRITEDLSYYEATHPNLIEI